MILSNISTFHIQNRSSMAHLYCIKNTHKKNLKKTPRKAKKERENNKIVNLNPNTVPFYSLK